MKNKETKSINIYLLISYPLKKEVQEKKEDLIFKDKNCKIIFSEKIEKNEVAFVILLNLINAKKKTIELEFTIESTKKEKIEYKIKFDFNKDNLKENYFIYDLKLFYRKGFSNEKSIKQNLDYIQKMKYFIDSLPKSEQKKLLDDLYDDTIKLYSKYPIFELLINLFVNIYDNKNVCPKLIKEFRIFNEKLTTRLNDPNSSYIVFQDILNEFVEKFKTILEKSKKLVEANSYNFTEFYGLIFCYLNHYDYDNFMKLFNDLCKNDGK